MGGLVAHDSQIGFGSRFTTTLTGGGRSVVGNVTIAFTASAIVGGVAAVSLAMMGQPAYALGAFAVPFLFFLPFHFLTLKHAAEYPDSAVTSEEHYVRALEARMGMGAKNARIVREELPILGASSELVENLALLTANERDDV